MSARDNILDRLRAVPPAAANRPEIDAARVAAIVPASAAAPIDRLKSTLETAHAEVVAVSAASWIDTLARLCGEKGEKTLAVGSASGIPGDFAGARLRPFDLPLEQWKNEFFDQVDAGFCRAECAIVDTGTLVLLSSPEQPRTLSLVPPVNFCLVDGRRLYPTMLDALRGEGWGTAMPTNLIFVSSPSKTADIQQTLAYGAHGPKELVVLLMLPEAA